MPEAVIMKYVLSVTLPFILVSAALFTAAPILADEPDLALEPCINGGVSASGLYETQALEHAARVGGWQHGRKPGSEADGGYENDIACFNWGARQFHPLTVDSSCCYLDPDRELFLVSGAVHCCCYRSRVYQG
jgi:hypothetical protein